MNKFKDTFPCIDCITYPICKNELNTMLKKEVYNNSFDKIYYCAYICFLKKCSLYKNYIRISFGEYVNTKGMLSIPDYNFEGFISPIIKQVFKLEEIQSGNEN